MMDFQGKSFLKEIDFNQNELTYLIDLALHFKQLKNKNIPHPYLQGQNIALIFEKNSTRTRSAFTVAANDLGANPEFLGRDDIQLGKKESIADTAKVLGSMFDGIQYRGFSQEAVELLAKHSGVPVWNGLTDQWHPTQMIADYMTIKEHFNNLADVHVAYFGDGRNNMANSLLVTGAILGVDVTICAPKKLFPNHEVQKLANQLAQTSGAGIQFEENPKQAVQTANVLYTDVWVSMGEEEEFKERIELLQDYQVNQALVDQALDDAIFLHCLPAFHDVETDIGKETNEKYHIKEMEVTDQVFQAEYSKQFIQAENRMHSIKAIMAATNGHLFIP